MNREYVIHKYFSNDGKISTSSERRTFNSFTDMKPKLIQEYAEFYKEDTTFVRVKIEALPNGIIDWELSERMSAIRDMCELGHKVRANTKIRNRQPLKTAYVAFSNRDIQEYMVYLEGKHGRYSEIISDELNVLNVVFMDEEVEKSLFNYNMKPNFRSLGPKGYGKQAQALKTHIAAMDPNDRNILHSKLKNGEVVSILDVPLTYTDVEIEFTSKENLMSASGKIGAIVLDTKLDSQLIEAGFIADFRSVVQNVRRDADLSITDKIFLEVFCNAARSNLIQKSSQKLQRDLLATGIKFFPLSEVNVDVAHRFYFHNGALKTAAQVQELRDTASQKVFDEKELDNEQFYVNLYREG